MKKSLGLIILFTQLNCWCQTLAEIDDQDSVKSLILSSTEREQVENTTFETTQEFLQAIIEIGKSQNDRGGFEEAIQLFSAVLKYSVIRNLNEIVVSCHINLGHAYLNKSDHDLALVNYYTALNKSEQFRLTNSTGTAYNSIGNALFKQKQYDQALEYYFMAVEIRSANNDLAGMASTYNGIGAVYNKKNELEESKKFISKSLAIKANLEDEQGIAVSNKNLGSIYYKQENYETALSHYFESLRFERKINKRSGMASSFFNIGISYYELENVQLATIYVDSSLKVASEIGYIQGILQAHQALSEIQEKKGNPEIALEHYRIYTKVKDSIEAHRNKEVLEALETKYELEKTEKQKIQLAKEVDLKTLELNNNRMLITVISLLFILIVFVIYQRLRNLKLNSVQKITQLDHKVLRAQINPHFLFNSLNSIQHFFLRNEVKKANKYLADFSILIRSILDGSTKTHNTIEEEIEFIERYLSLEQARLNGKFVFNIEVDSTIDIVNALVPTLILQPFVENSVWHGIVPKNGEGKIDIIFQREENTIHCIVSDNGIGLEQSKKKNQNKEKRVINAIQITEERLNLISPKNTNQVSIQEINKNGKIKGTEVRFSFPYNIMKIEQ